MRRLFVAFNPLFKSRGRSNLRGAVKDAQGFVNLLERKDSRLFVDSNIQLITDEQATTAETIKNALSALRGKTTKDDLVVFYFSGHVATGALRVS